MTTVIAPSTSAASVFPRNEVESRLRTALERLARNNQGIREPWEPDFDSLAVVGIVLVVEDLFPFNLAPEKIVRKGGYSNIDEAVQDITGRLNRQWNQRYL